MKIGEGVEWGIHCVVYLGFLPPERAMPTARLAEYHGVPAAYLAKHLQAMSRGGILDAVQGPRGGYRLARPPAEVTVLDVVEALDGAEPAFRCSEIRQRGPAAVPAREYRVPCSIHVVMNRADAAWRKTLREVTIAELMQHVVETASPVALVKGAKWTQEAMR